MKVSAEDVVALTDFPLRWRWTGETHAKFAPEELASIRPLRATTAAAITEKLRPVAVAPIRAEDRLVESDGLEDRVVGAWLTDRIPRDEDDVLLVWDDQTAALVPRGLFINRWDDFWYPDADDLTVMGVVAAWRIEMYHHGTFDFLADGAVERG